ncbi:MAG: signal peptide peptidase SppA [Phycisphaerae bacterium]|nr:signal peptide peptidase SppA [Phycisphaerae bacterium]
MTTNDESAEHATESVAVSGAAPAMPPAPPAGADRGRKAPRSRLLGRLTIGVLAFLLVGSVMLNVYLVLLTALQMESGLASQVLRAGDEEQVVAVFTVSGVIDDEQAGLFRTFARRVRNDQNVRAVVVRVNSPGGGVSASNQIHQEISRIRNAGKAVVVSMGGLAASGGYYISAGADEIVAEPTTITGSIGVIAQWPVLSGTLEKLGAKMIVLKSSHAEQWKDEMSPWREPSDEQRRHLRDLLDAMQDRFEQVVVEGRGHKLAPYRGPVPEQPANRPPPEYAAFNGKVYVAEQARTLGLIDTLGYRDKAIDRAAVLAGLDEPHVKQYYRRQTLRERMGFETSPGIHIDGKTFDEIQTPRILFMWKAR